MGQLVGRLLGEVLWPVLVAVPSLLVAVVVLSRAFQLRERSLKAAGLAGAAGVGLALVGLNGLAHRAMFAFGPTLPDAAIWLWSGLGMGLYGVVVVLFVAAACIDREATA